MEAGHISSTSKSSVGTCLGPSGTEIHGEDQYNDTSEFTRFSLVTRALGQPSVQNSVRLGPGQVPTLSKSYSALLIYSTTEKRRDFMTKVNFHVNAEPDVLKCF